MSNPSQSHGGSAGSEQAHVYHPVDPNAANTLLLKTALRSFMRIFGAQMGNIQILDLTGTHASLSIIAHEGFREPFLETFAHVSAENGTACGRALQSGEAVVIVDVDIDDDFAPYRVAAHEAGYRSVISVPIKTRWGHNVGIISAHFPHTGAPRPDQIKQGQMLARQLAHDILRVMGTTAP